MRVHLIAIGGAVMHNLALALQSIGHVVSGSDDEINEPSKSRLKAANLLPQSMGWNDARVDESIDCIILGMHARIDNPELIKAQALSLPVYSFPEFLYNHSKNKQRVVVGGSHGKTTITSMIMHILKECNVDFDFMVGSKLDGFDTMVQLSDAPLIILEGDEYLSSPIDRRPKFHLYHPHISVLSGIAHDHINVFPTMELYREQFKIFIEATNDQKGILIYNQDDIEVRNLVGQSTAEFLKLIPYSFFSHTIENGITVINDSNGNPIPLKFFGEHNLYNFSAAYHVCSSLGISKDRIIKAITSFKGAARRLELLVQKQGCFLFRDFAHSPSKVQATLQSVRNQYPSHTLIALFELHTFSSLNKDFLNQYAGTMNACDQALVYFNQETLKHKKLPPLEKSDVQEAFANTTIIVKDSGNEVQQFIDQLDFQNTVLLLMSSGTFDGLNIQSIIHRINALDEQEITSS
ncbi:MAG TPA: Mur ligase family protein [Bacteroidia bacterium]|nr:Mur ligase family protein [Bacteroidia bacterium]